MAEQLIGHTMFNACFKSACKAGLLGGCMCGSKAYRSPVDLRGSLFSKSCQCCALVCSLSLLCFLASPSVVLLILFVGVVIIGYHSDFTHVPTTMM